MRNQSFSLKNVYRHVIKVNRNNPTAPKLNS